MSPPKKKPRVRRKSPKAGALELIRFLEAFALGETKPTRKQVEAASRQLDELLPALPPVVPEDDAPKRR